ncbi:Na+/H+ antiporter NhaD-like permease [Sanguibacter keddieii DSM 10542]|uniref:Na+/H+ antiporter NhaD-like permease n=1 Tax=Sanguibacter keddieii (strain ATCC 51767 / DSM 10542 / NCFB 3025 / ST-74) TaxID=446469 RepID=D1BKB6_SANKS|nr:SLC13 family permease [Sanguibacter keddieii]ACZ20393.1 Na+/H+ antiporter NhaD-like permease [Sanguibacter keddieii DSM 10542]
MRSAVVGAVLLVVGAVTVLTGVLPTSEVAAVAERVWPVLLFVVMVTVVTELAAEAGLFTVVASRLARWGLDRAWLLWLLVVALATTSTVFLSLDTTAVLLTPVVVLLTRQVGLPPLPFALTTVWLANTGSLLLPVSNLTNLLAEGRLDLGSPAGFARLMVGPAVAAVVVPCLVLFVVFRRDLLRRYEPRESAAPDDVVLLRASAVVVGLLLPALVSGVEVWVPATVAALVLVVLFAVRRRQVLRVGLVPWQLVLLASGLFLVIEAGHAAGVTGFLASVAGTGDSTVALLQVSGVGALGANLVNNLPAYLALEPVADSPLRLAALLVGVNAGALLTPWASLATLLWHARLEALEVRISWLRYAALGLLVVPPTLVAAVLLLSLGR